MVSLLLRIPRPELFAVAISLVVGVSLLALKFLAYFLTGSAVIFSDAMESIVNVVASAVAFYSLAVAHSPADPEHPYGHGKIEFLSAAFEGGMIGLAALVIAFKAVDVLFFRTMELQQLGWGVIIMSVAMFVNGGVGLFLIRTGRKHKSLALEADGHHLLSDAVTSIAALLALIVMLQTQWLWLDPLIALFMAAYIGSMGYRLVRRAAAGLMDEQDVQDEQLLQQILDAHIGPDGKEPRICSYHKLRHRHSGRYHWVDFHIMVPRQMTVEQAHAVASEIEYEIELALGEGNATAHVEPCKDTQTCALGRKMAPDS